MRCARVAGGEHGDRLHRPPADAAAPALRGRALSGRRGARRPASAVPERTRSCTHTSGKLPQCSSGSSGKTSTTGSEKQFFSDM
jgi:hypothetical protein